MAPPGLQNGKNVIWKIQIQKILEGSPRFLKIQNCLIAQVLSTTISTGWGSLSHGEEHKKLAVAKEGEDV